MRGSRRGASLRLFLHHKICCKDGKEHRAWSVVENRRVEGGRVVEQQVLYLGEINDSQRAAWSRAIEVFDDAGQSAQIAELGLDQFEGRSWRGLHRHALMAMIAYAFLQHLRLAAASGGKRISAGPPQPTLPAIRKAVVVALARAPPYRCPHCRRQVRRPLN